MLFTGPHIAIPSDSHALATCHMAAFSSAGPRTLYNLIFSNCGHEAMVEFEAEVIKKSFAPGSRSKIVVMRDEGSGEIISYAEWILPASGEIVGEKEQKDSDVQRKEEKKRLDFPDGVNMGLFKMMFIDRGAPGGDKLNGLPVPTEQCWHLSRLGTKPEYQGKGAARALVKWATDQADHEGEYCSLSTDPEHAAFKAYEKAGFEVVGNVSNIALEQFGYEGVLRYVQMLRAPKKQR